MSLRGGGWALCGIALAAAHMVEPSPGALLSALLMASTLSYLWTGALGSWRSGLLLLVSTTSCLSLTYGLAPWLALPYLTCWVLVATFSATSLRTNVFARTTCALIYPLLIVALPAFAPCLPATVDGAAWLSRLLQLSPLTVIGANICHLDILRTPYFYTLAPVTTAYPYHYSGIAEGTLIVATLALSLWSLRLYRNRRSVDTTPPPALG